MAGNKVETKNIKTKSTTKKNTNTSKKSKNTPKKNNTKKTTVKKNTTPKVVVENIKKIEPVNTVEIKNISEQEKIENEVIKEVNNIKVVKLEDEKKKQVKKDKTLIAIGVVLSLLGLIALFISLISNRIIDKDILSDGVISLMLAISLVIEGFGAFIIVSET